MRRMFGRLRDDLKRRAMEEPKNTRKPYVTPKVIQVKAIPGNPVMAVCKDCGTPASAASSSFGGDVGFVPESACQVGGMCMDDVGPS